MDAPPLQTFLISRSIIRLSLGASSWEAALFCFKTLQLITIPSMTKLNHTSYITINDHKKTGVTIYDHKRPCMDTRAHYVYNCAAVIIVIVIT